MAEEPRSVLKSGPRCAKLCCVRGPGADLPQCSALWHTAPVRKYRAFCTRQNSARTVSGLVHPSRAVNLPDDGLLTAQTDVPAYLRHYTHCKEQKQSSRRANPLPAEHVDSAHSQTDLRKGGPAVCPKSWASDLTVHWEFRHRSCRCLPAPPGPPCAGMALYTWTKPLSHTCVCAQPMMLNLQSVVHGRDKKKQHRTAAEPGPDGPPTPKGKMQSAIHVQT